MEVTRVICWEDQDYLWLFEVVKKSSMDHPSCFVDTKLTKGQFLNVFSANIYLAHKVVMNLVKTNTLGIGNTCF